MSNAEHVNKDSTRPAVYAQQATPDGSNSDAVRAYQGSKSGAGSAISAVSENTTTPALVVTSPATTIAQFRTDAGVVALAVSSTGPVMGTLVIDPVTGKLTWSGDTNLYRLAADTLVTDDSLFVAGGLLVGTGATPFASISYLGVLTMGDGTATRDVTIQRLGAASLGIDSDVSLTVAGKGFRVKEGGAAAKMGTGTLNGASEVTIATTAVTATSRIFLSVQTPHGTPAGAIYMSSRSAGVSFGVKGIALDTSDFAWMIIEPSA